MEPRKLRFQYKDSCYCLTLDAMYGDLDEDLKDKVFKAGIRQYIVLELDLDTGEITFVKPK